MTNQRTSVAILVASSLLLVGGLALASGPAETAGAAMLTVALFGLVMSRVRPSPRRQLVLLQLAVVSVSWWLQALGAVSMDGPVAAGVTGGAMLLVALLVAPTA